MNSEAQPPTEQAPPVPQPVQQEAKPSKPSRLAVIPKLPGMLKEKLVGYRRVIEVARKPDREEFVSAAKITGFGIVLMGVIGFVLFIAYKLLIP
jgi:protein transport protein SEC61 subunit gamma-like protein